MSNAVRHGSPQRILVTIAAADEDNIRVAIVDDGAGIDATAGEAGFGLIGMTERIAALGGTLEVGNRPDARGVALTAVLPRFGRQPVAVP
jgi:two-component system sensor histidine kinase UhpB